MRFWCSFVSKKTPNNAVMPQRWVVPWRYDGSSMVVQKNIKISWDLGKMVLKIWSAFYKESGSAFYNESESSPRFTRYRRKQITSMLFMGVYFHNTNCVHQIIYEIWNISSQPYPFTRSNPWWSTLLWCQAVTSTGYKNANIFQRSNIGYPLEVEYYRYS